MFHGLQADNRDLPCDLEKMRKKDRVPVLRRDLSCKPLITLERSAFLFVAASFMHFPQ